MKRRLKRALSGFLVICFIATVTDTVLAQSVISGEQPTSLISSDEVDYLFDDVAANDDYFSKQEIIEMAKYHMNSYLSGQINGQDISVGSELVPIYDNMDLLTAWYVPFHYNSGEVAGHIMMGSNMTSYNYYSISETPDTYLNAKGFFEQNKQVVYLPFSDTGDDFILKQDDNYYDSKENSISFSNKTDILEQLENEQKLLEEQANIGLKRQYNAAAIDDTLEAYTETKEELEMMPENFGTLDQVYDRLYSDEVMQDNREENIKIMNAVFRNEEQLMKNRADNIISETPSLKASVSKQDIRLTEEWYSKPQFLKIGS